MHDILDVVMMATTAMSKKNATIQENYFKLGTKKLCMSEVEKCAISIRELGEYRKSLYTESFAKYLVRLIHDKTIFSLGKMYLYIRLHVSNV